MQERVEWIVIKNTCLEFKHCRGTLKCGAIGLSGSGLTKSETLDRSMLEMLPSNALDFDHGAVPFIGAIAAMPD